MTVVPFSLADARFASASSRPVPPLSLRAWIMRVADQDHCGAIVPWRLVKEAERVLGPVFDGDPRDMDPALQALALGACLDHGDGRTGRILDSAGWAVERGATPEGVLAMLGGWDDRRVSIFADLALGHARVRTAVLSALIGRDAFATSSWVGILDHVLGCTLASFGREGPPIPESYLLRVHFDLEREEGRGLVAFHREKAVHRLVAAIRTQDPTGDILNSRWPVAAATARAEY